MNMIDQKNKFLVTTEYKQFIELCDMCKSYWYIGICYGTLGVGKTFSGRYYTKWDIIKSILPPDHLVNPLPVAKILECNSIFYTTPITSSTVRVEREINNTIYNLNWLIGDITTTKDKKKGSWDKQKNYTKLIVIDEADRLKPTALEQVRDIYDRCNIGVVLIGMPGLDKKLSRYPQWYSRVCFVHNYKPIDKSEVEDIVKIKISELSSKIALDNEYTKEAITEIVKLMVILEKLKDF